MPSGVSTDLGGDPARRLEGGVEVPARAGAAEAREGEALAGEALGDVPGRVDPKHEEGDSARAGPAQSGQPVRDLLDACAEAGAQAVQIVSLRLRGGEERLVGHHDRPGRIIGQAM